MSHWLRFRHDGRTLFGTLDGDTISVYEGDMFDAPSSTEKTVPLGEIEYLTPCEPSKMIGLVNNFHAGVQKQGLPVPAEPLYFIKPPHASFPTRGTYGDRDPTTGVLSTRGNSES